MKEDFTTYYYRVYIFNNTLHLVLAVIHLVMSLIVLFFQIKRFSHWLHRVSLLQTRNSVHSCQSAQTHLSTAELTGVDLLSQLQMTAPQQGE